MMVIPAETLDTLTTFIKIAITIVATVIIAVLINRALVAYFKFASGKLKVDETTYTVVRRLIILTIYIIGGVVVIELIPGLPGLMLGMAAGAGIAAIVIGFAAQKVLSNIFGGISIAIFRPFRVGDVVEMEDEYGTVEDITLRHTVIRTWQNKRLIIPNTRISEESIINWTIEDLAVLWAVDFGISYDSDIDIARSIILDEIDKHPDVMHEEDKEVNVRVTELGDFAVKLRATFWVSDRSTAWSTGAEIRESVKKRFDSEGVEIPFPYRTVVYKKDMRRAG
ncbi:Large-conductance mechanosensitive channel MscMJLR [ANME-1 cluster archaeon GoMg2]|nr:Large-conductance mechanosensitive channel MscMJLR [ANME-1 cluster archaeon GoMg2]